jgi:hypothetical protein
MDLLFVSLASLLAGGIDSIVGGGGLILVPALFAVYPNAAAGHAVRHQQERLGLGHQHCHRAVRAPRADALGGDAAGGRRGAGGLVRSAPGR